jgi:hypothetical protein
MKIKTFFKDDLTPLDNFKYSLNSNEVDNIKYIKINDIFDVDYTIEDGIILLNFGELITLTNNFFMITIFYYT